MTTCPPRQSARSASLADRLDYLTGLATTVGLPTGSSDPFALRRAALGALAVHRTQPTLSDLSMADALTVAARHQPLDVPPAVLDHIRAALGHAQRPARTDAILTRLTALTGTPDFDRLVQTMQRARRIVPAGTTSHYDPGALVEPAEIRLHDTLGKTRAALDAITDLTHAVTEFFDHVYVMDDNPQRRTARLGLLATITELGEHTLAWEHLHA